MHTDDDQRPWSDEAFWVLRNAKEFGYSDTHVYYLGYDTENWTPQLGPTNHVCNRPRPDGVVCRLPADHDYPHMAFHVPLVIESGVYVIRREPRQPDDPTIATIITTTSEEDDDE